MPDQTQSSPDICFSPLLGLTLAGSALGLGFAHTAAASTYTQPSLPAGSHFRLMFTTSTSTTATSADIATYNSFVNGVGQGNADLPVTTWKAIASTAAVNAYDNVACDTTCAAGPIYLVDGTKAADSTSALFSGGGLLTSVIKTELGGTPQINAYGHAYVWNGSEPNGASAGSGLGTSTPVVSDALRTATYWLNYGTEANDNAYYLYGISGDLVIPGTAVPEPASLALLGAGLLGMAGLRRRATTH